MIRSGLLRAFCIMPQRLVVCCELKRLRREGGAKASVNSALSSMLQTRNLVIYPCAG